MKASLWSSLHAGGEVEVMGDGRELRIISSGMAATLVDDACVEADITILKYLSAYIDLSLKIIM